MDSLWQAQELSVPAVEESSPAPVSSVSVSNFGSISQESAAPSDNGEDLVFVRGTAPERLVLASEDDDTEGQIVADSAEGEAALLHSSDEQAALHNLFAELSQSGLAPKSLWEQIEA